MEEVWKDIKDYEGLYQVSNLGRVRSFKNKRIKSQSITEKGYCVVNLSKHNKPKKKKVHRLVSSAFIPNPYKKPEVNHKDFNKLNNIVDNLEWVTGDENITHYLRSIVR